MPSDLDNLEIYRRNLPHWRADHVTYFITWRIHKTNAPLEPTERTIVAAAIEYFHTSRYWLISYVVMDDHVHVLVRLSEGATLQSAVHSWKSYAANQLHRTLVRESKVWQDEYLDHIVRSTAELHNTIQYIEANPIKRWPDTEKYPWQKTYNI